MEVLIHDAFALVCESETVGRAFLVLLRGERTVLWGYFDLGREDS
jgi:hypothetical protein